MAATPRRSDRLLLLAFSALWLFCLSWRLLEYGTGSSAWIRVNAWSNGGPPIIQEFAVPDHEQISPLRVGDRIIAVDGADMRGAGQLRFGPLLNRVAVRGDRDVAVTVERRGERLELREPVPEPRWAKRRANTATSVVWGIAAILVLLRAPPTTTSRAIFFALASSALLYAAAFEGPGVVWLVSLSVAVFAVLVSMPLLVRAYLSFPAESNALHGWNRTWPWLFAALGVVYFSAEAGFPLPAATARTLATPLTVLYVLTLLFIVTRNYRRSGPVGRRQVKWVVFAIYVGTALAIGTYAIAGAAPLDPPLWMSVTLVLASIVFPVALLIAVLKFDLLDIDRLISTTVAYNALGFVVLGAGIFFVPGAAEDMSRLFGLNPTVGRTGFALALASLVIVVQRRVRPHVDRIFFRERFALERGMQELPDRLAVARRADELWNITALALLELVRPGSLVLYTSAGETFVPAFVRGDAVPPVVAGSADLVEWLANLDGATPVDRRAMRRLDRTGQAIMDNVSALAVVPIKRQQALEAFFCLGEKRSGDIYTHTDLTLLTALAKSLSIHLLRFDAAELLDDARAIQQKMRRYVPGAVAEQIALGRELEAGEREVAVLFVDIRGYTAFSDEHEPSTIFSTVNRFTEIVSTIVRECGGVVVEFNGDGMMAVFGAPLPLPEKEAAAVRAARRLVDELAADEGDASGRPLSIGVGVATGSAFVGNIEAVDRTIWTAIGSTINLAARLQSLTREIDASVLIDATTHTRAGDATHGWREHRGVAIRGKRETADVYALPLSTPQVVA